MVVRCCNMREVLKLIDEDLDILRDIQYGDVRLADLSEGKSPSGKVKQGIVNGRAEKTYNRYMTRIYKLRQELRGSIDDLLEDLRPAKLKEMDDRQEKKGSKKLKKKKIIAKK